MKNAEYYRERWIDRGCLALPLKLDQKYTYELRAEALESYFSKTRQKAENLIKSNPDGSFLTDYMFATADRGPALSKIFFEKRFIFYLRSILGMENLKPSRSSFNFYEKGDYLGIHKDSNKCDVTLIINLSQNLLPLTIYPSLKGAPNSELELLAKSKGLFPNLYKEVDIPSNTFLCFDGKNIPHCRVPHVDSYVGCIASMCFAN